MVSFASRICCSYSAVRASEAAVAAWAFSSAPAVRSRRSERTPTNFPCTITRYASQTTTNSTTVGTAPRKRLLSWLRSVFMRFDVLSRSRHLLSCRSISFPPGLAVLPLAGLLCIQVSIRASKPQKLRMFSDKTELKEPLRPQNNARTHSPSRRIDKSLATDGACLYGRRALDHVQV